MIREIDARNLASPEFIPALAAGRVYRIALLGCGTIGSAAARLLAESRERLNAAHGVDLRLTRILVRDAARQRERVEPALLTTEFEQVLRAQPDVVIEALGGREPAARFVEVLLERGISVVSANKTMIAHEGPRLEKIARPARYVDPGPAGCAPLRRPRLLYEASVGAAVPILAALRQRAGDPFLSLRAVLNGTCNFIISHMGATGCAFEVALREAIARGLAEPDPSADITGRDSAEKLCILARAAGIHGITPRDIPAAGISNITQRDLQAARELGCVIRLIAELEMNNRQPHLRVGPAFVPSTHPLARAKGAENAFVLDQELGGRLVLHGEGAGPKPTAAAILGDVLKALGASTSRAALRARRGDSSTSRCFVRTGRHAPIESLVQAASHVRLRRDEAEFVVEPQHAVAQDDSGVLIAPIVSG